MVPPDLFRDLSCRWREAYGQGLLCSSSCRPEPWSAYLPFNYVPHLSLRDVADSQEMLTHAQ